MISGCGMKNKVLEACATACPVVTTSLGASGLPDGADTGIIVADDPTAIATETALLLQQPDAADEIGRSGWEMVREQFSWQRCADRLFDHCRSAMPQRQHTDEPAISESGPAAVPSRQYDIREEIAAHASS
jgi:glycosyltransferase involved in cell wall biosynthesis